MENSPTDQTEEVLRMGFSGTIWFAAAVLGAALPLAGLLSSGWRPADLPMAAAAVWWIGAGLIVLSIAFLAYAGCPILGFSIPTEHRLKSLGVRGGLILFGAGAIMTMLAVLLSPG